MTRHDYKNNTTWLTTKTHTDWLIKTSPESFQTRVTRQQLRRLLKLTTAVVLTSDAVDTRQSYMNRKSAIRQMTMGMTMNKTQN